MNKPAKEILEKEYGITLSDKKPYYQHSSIEMLNVSGRLADVRIMARIIFALCDIVDKQQQGIDNAQNSIAIIFDKQKKYNEQHTPLPRPNATPIIQS